MGRLRDRVALVTGGASGIGRAIVERFLAEGARVVSLDRTAEAPAEDGAFAALVGDVRDPSDNGAAVALARERFGRLDVFVGNAGVHDGGARMADLSPAELDRVADHVLGVNVRGYLNGARAAADALRETRGCMVFTLSDASFEVRGVGAGIAYLTSKHAALGVVRGLAAELAPHVRVNGVAPGGVLTGLRVVGTAAPSGDDRSLFTDPDRVARGVRDMNPLGVMLSPAEVARHYLYLATEDSAGMTGQVLRPDGGLSVR